MKLCTFEIRTHVGRQRRLGAVLGGSIVLRFHLDDAVFDNYKIDPDKLHAIGRMGGPTYIRTTDRFDMARPKTGEIK